QYFGDIDEMPNTDFDLDGLPNLMEFALASNPSNPSSIPVYATNLQFDTETYFTFTYTRRAGDPRLQFSLEISNDLGTWESAAPYLETAAPTTFNADGTETLTLRDKRHVHQSPMRFLRLTVSTN
ncbi:uncharacterized protein METZ01_LOCUS336260, partial [marine metagenome]